VIRKRRRPEEYKNIEDAAVNLLIGFDSASNTRKKKRWEEE